MAFNGSGLFQRLYSWVNDAANSINIRADRMDAEMDGLASGLSNCITRDGQGKPSAAIDWNGQNLSNVNALSAASGAFSGAVNGATGTFAGAVSAASAAVTGAVTGATATFSGLVKAQTPTTGDRSTSLATTQMFADEFGASLGGTGWRKLPTGEIEQWGSGVTNGSGGTTLAYPIAFPNGVFQVVATCQTGIPGAALAIGWQKDPTNPKTVVNFFASSAAVIGFSYRAKGN